ncbi:uncharacterized protein LOC110684761 [Chenopodium quinoa]|uniref:uncharacterized protein LOC110684761 n=1 Tax=Chenopodium quinoa TaxID=63459 RepID=UPI000B776173|nr:uncharacterized protein LOC110684761 [Chenopodium quinoa]
MAQDRKTMQCYLLVYGTDSSYNPWVSYGENDKQDGNIENDENTMEVSNDEEDEMPFDDMAPLVFDATNAWNNNTTTSEVPIDSDSSYNPWVSYGENDKQDGNIENDENTMEVSNDEEDEMPFDDMAPLVFDATNAWNNNTTTSEVPIDSGNTMEFGSSSCNDETPNKEFMTTLLKDIEVELYPGCKTFKRLEFLVTLPHIKVSNKWSDKSFSMLLSALHRAFNHDKKFPANSYESKKYTKALGLDYIKIDACVNHCILFRKEFANEEKCPKCLAPRWKDKVVQGGDVSSGDEGDESVAGKKTRIPQLVLHHFPLIPRLQRMFVSSKLAKHMRWHKDERPNDEVMRHQADLEAWKSLDTLYPEFAADARNIRLGLASDGFNPGANMSSRYSIWPVMLVPYNLPPWMCMKSDKIILSLLIPGPKSSGNDINVFLQPLIDELKELWEIGVKPFDAHTKHTFNMRAVLVWTISDFPAYANLSGWSTKGKLACPYCHKDTRSFWLKHGRKYCYMDNRVFLETDHKWRRNRSAFGGKVERGPPPTPLTGHDVLEKLSGYSNVEFGKGVTKKRKKGEQYIVHQWKKESCFVQFPYWRHLLVRHNLDVMHTEKNVCESILGTLLDLSGKNKDSLNARLDLDSMKMHSQLRATYLGDKKWKIPPASYNLTLNERRKIVTFLSKLAFPDAYASNISRCTSLQDGKIMGMKTHDYHVFMQDLLTPAFKGVIDEKVLEPFRELSLFFKQLCSKTLKVSDLKQMESNIAVTLFKLERIFVPAFFGVMIHHPMHLATEARMAGPVHCR